MRKCLCAFAIFVFASLVLNIEKGYCQSCYALTPTVSCDNYHNCIDPSEALRSLALAQWEVPGQAMMQDVQEGKSSYKDGEIICAWKFDCHQMCTISPVSGNYMCRKKQALLALWTIENDELEGVNCPMTP